MRSLHCELDGTLRSGPRGVGGGQGIYTDQVMSDVLSGKVRNIRDGIARLREVDPGSLEAISNDALILRAFADRMDSRPLA